MTDQPVHASTRLRILREHARGGLGQVSVALDEQLNREVAFKEILPHLAARTASRERFIREAEITGGLEHPGVVPVYGLGEFADGRPFYAMRFVKGESLADTIVAFHRADGPSRDPGERSLALRKILSRFLNVCHTVGYAHSRGIIHRDLKPDNIMLGDYGETLVVDWGLAKPFGEPECTEGSAGQSEPPMTPGHVLSGSLETVLGSALGTPAYMSPEQAAGQIDELGPATDIYALGATL